MQPNVLREELRVAIGKLVVAPKPRIGTGIWNAIEPVVMISRSCLNLLALSREWMGMDDGNGGMGWLLIVIVDHSSQSQTLARFCGLWHIGRT